MTKIYYNENDVKAVKLVEDYFWFKDYLKSFHFDVVSNPQVKALLLAGFGIETQNELYDLVNQLVNKEEFLRFISVMRILFHHKGWDFVFSKNKAEELVLMMFHLDNDDKKMFSKIYKDKLIRMYGKNN